jgi:hypothetical protein
MARLAFWRDRFGTRIAAPLVAGVGLLLTLALLSWARENGRRIQELGPWAVPPFSIGECVGRRRR